MKRVKTLVPLGAVVAAVLTAIGQFKSDEGLFTRIEGELGGWAIVLVAILIAAVVVWLVSSRATQEGGKPATPAVVFAVLSVLSIAVFWTGLPSVFASGAIALGLEANERGSKPAGSIATAIGVLAVIAATGLAFTG